MTSIYDFTETEMSGQPLNLKDYEGKVVLIVNTASKCGFTPQLAGLEKLYQDYQSQGLVILGLPSNQFNQELETDQATADYCQVHYGVTFPMTKRVQVNGSDADPLFKYLEQESGAGDIGWNFTKFLVDRNGQFLERFDTKITPEEIEPAVVKALQN